MRKEEGGQRKSINCVITDKDTVIAVSGGAKKEFLEQKKETIFP